MIRRSELIWLSVIAIFVVLACGGLGELSLTPAQQYREGVQRMHQLATAYQYYLADNDDGLPIRADWSNVLYVGGGPPLPEAMLVSPIFDGTEQYGFAGNPACFRGGSGTAVVSPEALPLFYDSTVTVKNALADPSTMPIPPRYEGKNLIAYFDGHVPGYVAPPPTQLQAATTRLRTLATASVLYASDHDELLPLSNWADAIKTPNLAVENYRSPVFDGHPSRFGFAFASALLGYQTISIEEPSREPLLFDSTVWQWNAVSNVSTMPIPGRYEGQNLTAYADTHVTAR